MIDLKLLRTLSALKQTGSLQAAAFRLFLTQSALSHQLKEAENQLGCSLFIRKTQPVQFSSQGRVLIELAEQVLPLIDAAAFQLKSGSFPAQSIRLTVECHACFHWLLPAVKAFRAAWPEVNLCLASDIEHHAVEAMLNDELDLVLTTDVRQETQISFQPLFSLELKAFIYPEHPLAKLAVLTPEALADCTLLTYPIPFERQDIFRFFLKKNQFQGKLRQVGQASQILQLVAAGEGIAILPTWLAEPFLSQGLIVTKSLGEEGLHRQMYLASRRQEQNAASQALYQLLRQYAPN
jgi:LysR family transcriptional regulator for metE and metH